MFDPGLKIGEILKNSDIVEKFKCGNMGGMRRSKTTNTLVIVSDYTKGSVVSSITLVWERAVIRILRYTCCLWAERCRYLSF